LGLRYDCARGVSNRPLKCSACYLGSQLKRKEEAKYYQEYCSYDSGATRASVPNHGSLHAQNLSTSYKLENPAIGSCTDYCKGNFRLTFDQSPTLYQVDVVKTKKSRLHE
jgi:hypothetical protein